MRGEPPAVYGETVGGFLFFLVIYQGRKYFLSGIEEKDEILWYNIKWNNKCYIKIIFHP